MKTVKGKLKAAFGKKDAAGAARIQSISAECGKLVDALAHADTGIQSRFGALCAFVWRNRKLEDAGKALRKMVAKAYVTAYGTKISSATMRASEVVLLGLHWEDAVELEKKQLTLSRVFSQHGRVQATVCAREAWPSVHNPHKRDGVDKPVKVVDADKSAQEELKALPSARERRARAVALFLAWGRKAIETGAADGIKSLVALLEEGLVSR